jgi:hypothetical protein
MTSQAITVRVKHALQNASALTLNLPSLASRPSALRSHVPQGNVMMPLASAMHHLREAYRPASGSHATPTLALAVCVLDAPMILVEGSPENPTLDLMPWIRVVRQEKHRVQNCFEHSCEVVDFFHRDGLSEFVREVLAFASVFRERAINVLPLIRNGRAKVSDLNKWTWQDISNG